VTWASTETGQERIVPISTAVKQILQQHKASMEALGIYDPHRLVLHTQNSQKHLRRSDWQTLEAISSTQGSSIGASTLNGTLSFPMLER